MGAYRWRGLCWCWCLVVCVLAVEGNPAAPTELDDDVTSMCEMTGCNCTVLHKYWQVVNCTFDSKQTVNLRAGALPANTIELSVTGGQNLKVQARVFSTLQNFQRLRIDGAGHLVVQQHAFANLTVNSLLVQVQACDSLLLETGAFRNMKGPVTAEISRCGYVTVQRAVFGFLQDASFYDVPRLEVAEGAFTLDTRDLGHHGAVTTIRFRKVMIPVLLRDVFKSSLAEVSLIESEVRDVQAGSFSGNTIAAVFVANSSLHRVRGRAFSDRTQLDNLALHSCRLHAIDTDAILAAVANLTVQHSNITVMNAGAINATIARMVFRNNIVGSLNAGALAAHDWSRLSIDGNEFGRISPRGLAVADLNQNYDREFSFTGNKVRGAEPGSLFALSEILRVVPNAKLRDNRFTHSCHCDIQQWLDDTLGDNCSNFASDNYCTIDPLLAQCHEINDSVMIMKNFTDLFCEDGSVVQCKTFSADANVGIDKQFSADESDNNNLILGLVLGLVFLVAVCGTVVILIIRGGLWLKRKGFCVRFKNFNYRTEEGSTEAEDIMVAVDKTPDNIPEELTQELLQMLREKLEDPTTYNEAREMIERLYDHFIIEDSYTNNNRQEEETHLYEELGNLQQPQANGTEAAPVDKSTPATRPFSFLRLIEERFNLAPSEPGAATLEVTAPSVLADEYSEPTDAEVHLYSELPQHGTGKEGRQNEINEVLNRGMTPSPAATPSPAGTHNSGRMAYRPLPPQPSAGADPGEGPSTKF